MAGHAPLYRKLRDERYYYRGSFTDGGVCRLRIFAAEEQPPLVVLTELPENTNTSITNLIEYLVPEVISKFLPHRWEFDPPVLVLEHYPPRRSPRDPEQTSGQPDYDVVTFEAWRPTTTWQAGIKRIRLGEPAWHHLLNDEVAALIGADEVYS